MKWGIYMRMQVKTEYDKWLEFCKEIMGRVQDKEFLSNIIKLLDELEPYKVRVKNNTLTCVLRKNGSKKITISISDKKVFYKVEEKDVVKTGTYQVSNNGKSFIKYSDKNVLIFNNLFQGQRNRKYDVYNVEEITKFYAYDEAGYEIWYLKEEKYDNYYLNKRTKERIIKEPNCFENYIDREYIFREDGDLLIKRIIRKYYHPENGHDIRNEDAYLIQKNWIPNSKKMPKGGNYVGIPKEEYSKYKLKEISSEELYKTRVRVRGMDVHYI